LPTGVEQPGALPFVEAEAHRLAGDAQRLGDLALADGARETHVPALGDAEIVGRFDEPVGEGHVAVAEELGRFDVECRYQPIERQLDEAGAHRVGFGEQRRQQRERNAVEVGRHDGACRRAPDCPPAAESGGDELELAERIAGNDVLDVRLVAGLAGR
jgi:hypothetical protein